MLNYLFKLYDYHSNTKYISKYYGEYVFQITDGKLYRHKTQSYNDEETLKIAERMNLSEYVAYRYSDGFEIYFVKDYARLINIMGNLKSYDARNMRLLHKVEKKYPEYFI